MWELLLEKQLKGEEAAPPGFLNKTKSFNKEREEKKKVDTPGPDGGAITIWCVSLEKKGFLPDPGKGERKRKNH